MRLKKQGDLSAPKEAGSRVLRGGSCLVDFDDFFRAAFRYYHFDASYRYYDLGLRCAASMPDKCDSCGQILH